MHWRRKVQASNLPRQSVTAPKLVGDKTSQQQMSGRQNVDTKMSELRTKNAVSHRAKKIFHFIWRQEFL